jgi:hypothetical protein
MSYKANRIIIGDIANRQAYLEENPRCEICGSSQVNIHHHYKLGKRYLDQNFEIELPENYSSLCLQHHSIIHTDENQYNRRIWGHSHNGRMCWKDFGYWHEGKDGRGFAEIVEEHLKEQNKCIS